MNNETLKSIAIDVVKFLTAYYAIALIAYIRYTRTMNPMESLLFQMQNYDNIELWIINPLAHLTNFIFGA